MSTPSDLPDREWFQEDDETESAFRVLDAWPVHVYDVDRPSCGFTHIWSLATL